MAIQQRDRRHIFTPAYLLLQNGVLAERVAAAWQHLQDCDLYARYCRSNRLRGSKGAVWRTGEHAVVYGCGLHHGEEDPLRGTRGSGSIFFSWCKLRCVFCQNREIRHKGQGPEIGPDELAGMLLTRQRRVCHNISQA